jgi:hypothetical protein
MSSSLGWRTAGREAKAEELMVVINISADDHAVSRVDFISNWWYDKSDFW